MNKYQRKPGNRYGGSRIPKSNKPKMRQFFNPYEGCPRLKSKNKSPFAYEIMWVYEAVNAALSIAYVYNSFQNTNGDFDKVLDGIQRKLDELKYQLDRVNRQLDRIIDMLNDLPRVIRGELKEEYLRQAYIDVGEMLGLVRTYSKKEFIVIDHNQGILENLLNSIQIRLGGIHATSGLAGMLNSAPFIAGWLGGQVALQKARKQTNPNWPIMSPWQQEFLPRVNITYANFITQCETLDYEYDRIIIPKLPRHGMRLKVQGGKFVPEMNHGPLSYRLICPTTFEPEKLQYGGSQRPEKWEDVSDGSIFHQSALAAKATNDETRRMLVEFYGIAPKLHAKKNEILGVFVEPANIWSTNNTIKEKKKAKQTKE